MNDEQSWMANQSADESAAKERYDYFTRPEPRENLSAIRFIDDPYLGRTKVRDVKIGMVRNAADENRKEVLAYLEPFPHIRIDAAKPLQGWYKSLHEPPTVRPRPCFTEAILTEPYGGYCLPGKALVETPYGAKPIQQLQVGDIVVGQRRGRLVLAEVLATVNRWCEDGLLRLTTDEGDELELTAEHPIFSISENRYVRADQIKIGEKIEARSVQAMRSAYPSRQMGERVGVLQYAPISSRENESAQIGQARPGSGNLDLYKLGLQEPLRKSKLHDVRKMRKESSNSSREDAQRRNSTATKGSTKNARSQSQASQSADGQKAYESDETKVRRVSTAGDNREYVIQEEQIRVPTRKGIQSKIELGENSCRVSGSTEIGLGLRTGHNSAAERGLLSARFQIGGRNLHRSQGLSQQEGSFQAAESEYCWVSHYAVQRNENEAPGFAVVSKINRIGKPLRVYDIQTTAENFYVRGVNGIQSFHVHNCAVGCQFCYINSGMRGYRGTGLISVPLNYGEQIAKQLSKMRRGAAGYFSSFTDPFTPLEDYYHNTQLAAEEFVKVGLPIFFLSRLRYPDWAVDMLTKNPHSYAQKSINTSDAEDWRHLSPGALGLQEHLNDIARLKSHGIYISIQVNPIVAGITTNEQIVRLFKMLKDAGADHVIVKFVEAAYSWAPAMVERLKKVFGEERGRAFEELFTENIGGERTIAESYRMKAHKLYSTYARRYGLTYATCYEYKYERDESGKILSKTGVSIGRDFTTADQCHGQRVPVYARDNEADLFKPLDECPPSGCLYCAAENGGEARCGDELAGTAAALKLVDLKIPIGMGKSKAELPIVNKE